MTTDADDLDHDNAKREETADDIGMRTVSDFYKTWTPDASTAPNSHNSESDAHRDPRSYLYSKDVVGDPTDITSILRHALPTNLMPPSSFGEQGAPSARAGAPSRFSPELDARRLEIRRLAEKTLGSVAAVRRWLGIPVEDELMGKTPIDLMETLEGCDQVQRFLMSQYSPKSI
ncbi:DUF2384 domain-containing protein [Oxalobacteraceae sp. CFBP 8753]|nr:DUF2384 domain-containing protein [Oxalobacteraceae sp. CFBP 8753]